MKKRTFAEAAHLLTTEERHLLLEELKQRKFELLSSIEELTQTIQDTELAFDLVPAPEQVAAPPPVVFSILNVVEDSDV